MSYIHELRCWTHKILPLVYDDSLSYYELLSKVMSKLNEVINTTNSMKDVVKDAINEIIAKGEFADIFKEVLAEYLKDTNKYRNMERFGFFFSPYCPEPGYYPQGACLIDDETMVEFYSAENNDNSGYIRKVNLRSGSVLKSVKLYNICHGNTLSYIKSRHEIYSVNYYNTGVQGYSDIITVLDADTFEVKRSFTVDGIKIACVSVVGDNLYISTRDTYFEMWKCGLDGENPEKLFTSDLNTVWLTFVDKDLNVYATNAFNLIYVLDIEGNMLQTSRLDFYSADYSNILQEMECFMQLSDGTMIMGDMGYKRKSEGLYRRRILNTLNVSKIETTNYHIRNQQNAPSVFVTNTYNPLQNGLSVFPYDSIDYAVKVCNAMDSIATIYGGNEVFDQWVCVRNTEAIWLNNMTIQGLVVDYSNVHTGQGLIIKSGCAQQVADYVGSNEPCCVCLWRNATLHMGNGTIDGENNGVVGVRIVTLSTPVIEKNIIVNCDKDMTIGWGIPISLGNYKQYPFTDNPYNTYHRPQLANNLPLYFGGNLGHKTVELENTTLANLGNIKFDGQRFVGSTAIINVNYNPLYIDLYAGGRGSCTFIGKNGLHSVTMDGRVENGVDGATLYLTVVAHMIITQETVDGVTSLVYKNANREDVPVNRVMLF